LTLETGAFLAGAGLRERVFAGAFLVRADVLADALAVTFFAALRATVFVAAARLALGFAALALTGRFAVLADALRPAVRDPGRRRPFVRLLLIVTLSWLRNRSIGQPWNARSLA